jgi:chromosome segregation ATPase
MEAKLKEIKQILESASISNDELVGVQTEIDKISSGLADTTAKLNDLDSDLAGTKQSMMQGNSQLEYLRSDADKLKLNAQDMKDSITRLSIWIFLLTFRSVCKHYSIPKI